MVNFGHDIISYDGKPLVVHDGWGEAYVYWAHVNYAINDIPISKFYSTELHNEKRIDSRVDFFLMKSYALALQFARNYGFASNIDTNYFNDLWSKYIKKAGPKDVEMFDSELLVTTDVEDTSSTIYEDIEIVGNRKFTVYSTVDWKAVLRYYQDWERGSRPLDSEGLIALGLLAARDQGLKEGKIR